jgi:hypothetical protein
MRRYMLTLAAVLLGSMCAELPSSARAAETRVVAFSGLWKGGAYSNDQTHTFSHCSAFASYVSGITMFVGVTRDFAWNLGFAHQQWNLAVSQDIPVTITFDGSSPWFGTARATTPRLAIVSMPPTSTLVGLFRGAYHMTVVAAGQTCSFNLDKTSRLMIELSHCVGTELAIERGEPPPSYADASPTAPPSRSAVATNQPPPRAVAAELELAATRIASNLLLQAKLPNAHILSPTDTPAFLKGRGVAWTSDAGPGAVELLSAAAGKDPQQVATSLVSADATDCKGDFASGRSSDLVDNKVVTKAASRCKDSDGIRTFTYFILQGEPDGYIVYVLSGSGNAVGSQDSSTGRESTFQSAAVKAAFPSK